MQKSELINKISTVLGIISTLISITAAIYGICFVLPNFIKQKRLEFFSINAAKAMEYTIDVEEAFRKLTILLKKPCNEKEHFEIQLEISRSLNNLRTRLLFLRAYPEILRIIPWIESLRLDFNQIFEFEKTCEAGSREALDEFNKYWKSNSELTFKRIEEIREELLNIFEIKQKENLSVSNVIK